MFSLFRAKVYRASTTNLKSDGFWVEFAGPPGRILLFQAPGTLLETYSVPAPWEGKYLQMRKTGVLLLSNCCTTEVLDRIAEKLAPVGE